MSNLYRQPIHSFAFTLWMRFADLAGAEAALDLMRGIPEADMKPFEALSDVFLTQKDPSHLHRLAPERARFVTELFEKGPASARRRRRRLKS